MARAKKMTHAQVEQTIKGFASTAYAAYNTHAFSAGYFESMAARLIADLPAHRQAMELEVLQRYWQRMQREASR